MRRKKSYCEEQGEADDRIRRLLLKEAKRRRLEIVLQSTAAITLPMFLVTPNYFTMNVPDLPQLSFWYVLALTVVAALAILGTLFFVWGTCFWNRVC